MMKEKVSKKFSIVSIIMVLVVGLALSACQSKASNNNPSTDGKHKVVATTTMLADMAKSIGGDQVVVDGLMGPGIDPHLYKASAGDVTLMQNADLIVYSGLHLEGKMGDVLENIQDQGKLVVEIARDLPEESLIVNEASGAHDPHIWFDVMLWKEASANLYKGLVELDPENQETYQANYEAYMRDLDDLDAYIREQIAQIPEEERILVTAHDAFSYFGRAYGFQVVGLQGISTSSEAGTADVRNLADFIVEKKIKALFVESSVPKKNIEALQEAVAAQGFDVGIGGELYSDALGSAGTEAETYVGTVRANIDTIVSALRED